MQGLNYVRLRLHINKYLLPDSGWTLKTVVEGCSRTAMHYLGTSSDIRSCTTLRSLPCITIQRAVVVSKLPSLHQRTPSLCRIKRRTSFHMLSTRRRQLCCACLLVPALDASLDQCMPLAVRLSGKDPRRFCCSQGGSSHEAQKVFDLVASDEGLTTAKAC